MEAMRFFAQLLTMVQPLFPGRALNTAERGCLAMAAQQVARMERQGDTPREWRWLCGAVTRGDVNNTCYLLLDLAYQEHQARVKENGQSPPDGALIQMIYDSKREAAHRKALKDFILTGTYAHYPAFFQAYDALTHTNQAEGIHE